MTRLICLVHLISGRLILAVPTSRMRRAEPEDDWTILLFGIGAKPHFGSSTQSRQD